MPMKASLAKTMILAGIPFLAFPFFAEAGMSGDWSQRDDRARGQSFDNQQIVQGEISKKNGDEITLRTRNGERITFRINDQTNQLCPKGTQTSQTSSMNKGSSGNQNSSMGQGSSTETSSMGHNQMGGGSTGQGSSNSGQTSSSSLFGSQNAQASNQSSSQGSSGDQTNSRQVQQGFRFGDCNFQNGEYVKAKLDRQGNATFVRSMGQNDGNYFSAGRAGDDYFVLPAGELGGLDISDKDSHYAVKSSAGEKIGEVYRIMTSRNGDLTYAIIKKKDGQLISVPWQALEGEGNKSFKLKVTQNQLGNLPILEEGENSVQHVQKHWDLTEQQRQDLAQWNERLDRFYRDRDRYYEDTPTFEGNREGYDRYDQRQSRMNRAGNDRQQHYQDQNFDDSQVRHYGFSPSEFPPPDQAPQYERDDRQGSFDRNRQGRSSTDYRDRGNRQYSRSQDENFNSGDRYYRNQSRSNMRNYDYDDYRNQGEQQSNRGNQQSMYSQSRERNYSDPIDRLSDRYNTTTSRSQYDSQRQGADQYQSRRSGGKDYDYRPEGYRP